MSMLPPILLTDPAKLLQQNTDSVGVYLTAVVKAIAEVSEKVEKRVGRGQRRKFGCVGWLVKSTRKKLLGRYWGYWAGYVERARRLHLLNKLKAINWIEKEYGRMTMAIQDILSVLSKEREDKAVIQGSIERLAHVCNETQSQLEMLHTDIGSVLRNSPFESHIKNLKVHLLQKSSAAATLSNYFNKLKSYRYKTTVFRKRLRATRFLLRQTTQSILKARLRDWMLYLQTRVNRKMLRKMNKQAALKSLTSKPNLNLAATYYSKISRFSKAWRKLRRNHKTTQHLMKKTSKTLLKTAYDALEGYPTLIRQSRFEATVIDTSTAASRMARVLKKTEKISLRHRNHLVEKLMEHNTLKTIRRYWAGLAVLHDAVKRMKRRVRASRWLMLKTQGSIRRSVFAGWKSWVGNRKVRRRIIERTKLRNLTIFTSIYYRKLWLRTVEGRRERRRIGLVRYLTTKSAVNIARRAFVKLSVYAVEANRKDPTPADVETLTNIVEGVVTQTSLLKSVSKKHQALFTSLRVRYLTSKSRDKLIKTAFLKLLAFSKNCVKTRRRHVAATRLNGQNNKTFLKSKLTSWVRYAKGKIQKRTLRSRQENRTGFLVMKNVDKILMQYYTKLRQAVGRGEASTSKAIVVAHQIRYASRGAAVAVLSARQTDRTNRILRACYTDWARYTTELRKRRVTVQRHRVKTQNLRYLYNTTLKGMLRVAYGKWQIFMVNTQQKIVVANPVGSSEDDDTVRRWVETQKGFKAVRDKLVGIERDVEKVWGVVEGVDEGVKGQVRQIIKRVERLEAVDIVKRVERLEVADCGVNEVKDVVKDLSDVVRGWEEWRAGEGETVASLQRQMANTSSVLNKLIDRLMAVDEHLERLDKQPTPQPTPTRKPLMPPGPPERRSIPLSAATTAKIAEAQSLHRNISPPRNPRPDEKFMLLHATSQSSPSEPPTSLPSTGKLRKWC